MSVTVTSHFASLSPALAVIVLVPAATAVTMPLLTFATFVLLEVQVTVLLVAFSGVTVAVKVSLPLLVPFTVKESVFLLNVTLVTATSVPVAKADGTIEQTIAITRSRDSNLRLMFFITFSFPSFHTGLRPKFGSAAKDTLSNQCENFVSDLYPFCIFSERCLKFLLLPPLLPIDAKTG